MRRHVSYALLALSIAGTAVACGDDDPTGPRPELFRATLNGANERPDPRTTPATGVADLSLLNDVLTWSIALSNITNVSASHIHIGDASVAGGILLPLNVGTNVNNTLLTGSIAKSAYVAPGAPNAGVTWDQLVAMMRAGTVYVNVHTSDPNLAGNNTAGDFPGGEIRGQVHPR